MPTTSQSPGPNPTTSQSTPKTARSRKAADQSDHTVAGRAGSQGGIKLEKELKGKNMGSPGTKAAVSPAGKDAANPAASTGPNRQRRRPRKLNKEPISTQKVTNPSTAQISNGPPPLASTTELEALKSRVRGLEAKVEELYNNGADARSARSPRRRGKGRKGSSTQASAGTTPAEPTRVEQEEEGEEADEELVRLEGELEVARRDLESYQPRNRPRTKRSVSEETEYIEEIPREEGPVVDDTVDTGGRQVTLTGNYRIPLPASVSMADVKSIQSGVSAAQNVARSFLEQRRAQQALNAQEQNQSSTRSARTMPTTSKSKTSSKEVAKGGDDKQSWGEWFGGYSMAISKAVKNIEAEAAIESQRTGPATRPTQGRRTASAPSSKKASNNVTPGTKGQPRPGMKARQTNLSSQQVQGLME